MADVKVTELDAIPSSGINPGVDVVPLADVSAGASFKATPSALLQAGLEAGVTLSNDVVIDGGLTESVDFNDINTMSLDATTLHLSGVESVELASTGSGAGQGEVSVRADQSLYLLPPSVVAGTAVAGQVMRLTDPSTGESDFGDLGDVGGQLANNSIPSSKLKTTADADKVQIANLGSAVIAAMAGALSPADYLGEITSLGQSIPAASASANKWYSAAIAGALTDPDVSGITVAVGDRIVSNGTAWLKYAAPPVTIADGSITRIKLDTVLGANADAFTTEVPNLLESGASTPPFGHIDQASGLYTFWVDSGGRFRTARNAASEVAVLTDIPPNIYDIAALPMSDGNLPPPFCIADPLTGLLSFWVDSTGKVRTPNGEVATKPASGVEPIQEIVDGLPTVGLMNQAGVEVAGIDAIGALTVGDIDNASDHGLIIVDIQGPSNLLRVTHRSPARGSNAWIQYTWSRYFSSTSTGTWVLDSIVRVRRPNSQSCDFSTHAHAVATVSSGQVTGVAIYSGRVGRGYVTAPQVIFFGGGGSGAAATATIDGNGSVTGFTITNNGSGYTTAPSVRLEDTMTSPLVWGGMNDIVWSESSSGVSPRYSIDYPSEVVTEGFIGGGHGSEFIAGLQASSPVLYPSIYLDGVQYDASKNTRVLCRHFRMAQRTDLYRNRSPAQVPGGARSPSITQVKEWTIAGGQLNFKWDALFNEQFTGTVYAPLYCFQNTYGRLWRDSDMLEALVPSEYDSGLVGNTVPGVTRIRFYSALHGLATLSLGEAEMWASGQRPYGTRISPGLETFFVKTDPDINKVYWSLGSTMVNHAGTNYYRAAANERWSRSYSLQFIV